MQALWIGKSISLCYLVAFMSLWVQLPGLFGFDGLQPIDAFLSRLGPYDSFVGAFFKLPTLVWAHHIAKADSDVMMEFLCLVGAAVSTINTLLNPTGLRFAIQWILYLSCYLVGQTFLSFQWDILLLETGFIAIFMFPFVSIQALKTKQNGIIISRGTSPHLLLLRFLLFKLMWMSGVVKIQSECPTWFQLTALEYHYATQCIPTPLAWYAHQLPPLFQRFSVAATLFIELPAAILILFPFRVCRITAAAQQIVLQIAISLTGNYNFFNALTAVLAASLLVEDIVEADGSDPKQSEELRPAWGDYVFKKGPILACERLVRWIDSKRLFGGLFLIFLCIGSAYICSRMFTVVITGVPTDWPSYLRYDLDLSFSRNELEEWVRVITPYACAWATACLLYRCMCELSLASSDPAASGFFKRAIRLSSAAVSIAAAVVIFSVSVVPFVQIDRTAYSYLPPYTLTLYNRLQSQHLPIASGYGLFRSMTGVGESRKLYDMALPVPARPEIILEGSLDGAQFEEINFMYKPGDPLVSPPWVIPHQPRLDWQMWFAALGTYQNAPWIIHLTDKLLEGAPDVYRLLDLEHYPFTAEGLPNAYGAFNLTRYGKSYTLQPPRFIRAQLFAYDFTRANTTWWRLLQYTSQLPVGAQQNEWWQRKYLNQYLPPLEKGNESVKKFLDNFHWSRLTKRQRKKELKLRGRHPSRTAKKSPRDSQENHTESKDLPEQTFAEFAATVLHQIVSNTTTFARRNESHLILIPWSMILAKYVVSAIMCSLSRAK